MQPFNFWKKKKKKKRPMVRVGVGWGWDRHFGLMIRDRRKIS